MRCSKNSSCSGVPPARAAEEGAFVGGGIGYESGLLAGGFEVLVDRDGGRFGQGLEGPEGGHGGAVGDPAGEVGDLIGGELAGGRHFEALVGAGDSLIEEAGFGVAGDDGGAGQFSDGVAALAIFNEEGADALFEEFELLGCPASEGRSGEEGEKDDGKANRHGKILYCNRNHITPARVTIERARQSFRCYSGAPGFYSVSRETTRPYKRKANVAACV